MYICVVCLCVRVHVCMCVRRDYYSGDTKLCILLPFPPPLHPAPAPPLTAEISIPQQPQSPAPLQLSDSTSLSCTTDSNPRANSITWFRVQNRVPTPLVSSGDISIRSENVGTNGLRSNLQLRITDDMSFADYFCHGSNGFRTMESNHVAVTRACEYL